MTDLARTVLHDWQSGRMRWTDAVAALGLAGLPQLYAAAYRHGVPIERRFADELQLPDLARRDRLTPPLWKANPAWREVWHRAFEHDRGVYRVGWAGHAQRRSESFDRDVWWLIRQQLAVDWNARDMERMQKAAEADRARLRRILHRVTWFEMTFYPMPEDPCRAVVELWSNAGTSTKVACEILDVDLAGLVVLSMELLVPPRPGVSMIVTPAGLPDSVLERIRKLADDDSEDDA
ncbi:hypothetical protein [Aureimonas sp. N4]|uniref:hypothetical protein n=1 Tax=Aureimonas sp. N4 TaxID=1638165 RepID=UPI000781EBFB|nr:hypothetical protein [Aureimonas sp. N4]